MRTKPQPHLLVAVVLASVFAGCRAEAPGFDLATAVAAGDPALAFPRAEAVDAVEIDDERRPALVAPATPWSWRGRVPRGARLVLGVGALGDAEAAVALTVEVVDDGERVPLLAGRGRPGAWLDLAAGLGRWEGREVTLEMVPRVDGPQGAPPRLAWSHAALEPPPEADAEGPPNIVLIVVDTLRADHLTPYGYPRDTSPHLESLLAARGVVVERAYAQAPWTMPSAVSYLTGRYPGELLDGPLPGFAIPPETGSLAERLAAAGYETGVFYGNFILRDANGFGRGFATRYTPPARGESNLLHADTLNRRALAWLAARQRRPFFLYVHYMDPHDPYLSPELENGRSPFLPGYDGPLTGEWVHGLYMRRLELPRPARDLAQLAALYDSEVAYVDRALGELLAALEPEVAANTLFVFTADHGEELGDHGGFKHGQTLYEEMLRVPLVVRWDGRLPAGRRLAGPVELVDLAPTLAAAAGVEPDRAWPGRNLLPALAGEAELERRPAFAEGLGSGPLRAAAIWGDAKLVLFDRAAPFRPGDEHQAIHWRHDLERFARREIYDLAADPGEHDNLAAAEAPAAAAALAAVIHQRLDPALGGLKVIASGLAPGERLGGRIRFERPPSDWHSYFLADADRVELDGEELTFEWIGEEGEGPLVEKGVRVEGDFGGIREIAVTGGAIAPGAPGVLVGGGEPYRGGGVAAERLVVRSRPRAPQGPALRLWIRAREAPAAAAGDIDPEVEESLRALGYIR